MFKKVDNYQKISMIKGVNSRNSGFTMRFLSQT